MKFSFRTIVFVLCCILAIHPFAKAEPSIQIAGVTTSSKACRAFMEENPNVHVQAVLTPFQSTTELINALLTRSFVYDDFLVSSNRFDIDTLIESGLLDKGEAQSDYVSLKKTQSAFKQEGFACMIK